MPEGLREDPYHWTELTSLNKDYYHYHYHYYYYYYFYYYHYHDDDDDDDDVRDNDDDVKKDVNIEITYAKDLGIV